VAPTVVIEQRAIAQAGQNVLVTLRVGNSTMTQKIHPGAGTNGRCGGLFRWSRS
jgi:hypothetical protein